MNPQFSIFQLTESDINLSAVKVNKNDAHTHDYEELIIGIEGDIEHFIDYKTVNLSSPFVSFVTSGKIHVVQPFAVNGKCNIWALKFKSEFIPETTFQLYSYYHDRANLQISRDISIKRITAILQMMAEEMQQQDTEENQLLK
jgi:AraC family transcriptional activator of pobA